VLAALAPRGLGERIRARVAGGWTAAQVWARMDALAFPTGPAGPVDEVHRVLVALAADGRVTRRSVRWTTRLNTKGHRDMVVDVFRLR
jgi:hypothetical protein